MCKRSTSITDIAGIAERRAARLLPHGIHSFLDLALADRKLVRSLLTIAGEAIWWELNGEPIQALRVNRPRHKMLSRGGSLGEATAEPPRSLVPPLPVKLHLHRPGPFLIIAATRQEARVVKPATFTSGFGHHP